MTKDDLRSNKTIAHSILDELKKSGHDDFSGRPLNRFQPATTLWWISPTKETPRYKYGKIAVSRHEDKHRIGVHIEKGISSCAVKDLELEGQKAVYATLADDWKWNVLMKDIENKDLEDKLNKITEETSKDLKISLHLYPYSRSGDDSESDTLVNFNFKDGELKYIKKESKGYCSEYSKVKSFSELKKILSRKEKDWYWINLYIVFELEEDELVDASEYGLAFVDNYPELFEI